MRIERGGNYGWSVREASHPVSAGPPNAAQRPFSNRWSEHNHADFRSLTGGYVYRGSRLPELNGAYIYGDYDTGRVWALRYDGRRSHVAARAGRYAAAHRLISAKTMPARSILVDFMGGVFY